MRNNTPLRSAVSNTLRMMSLVFVSSLAGFQQAGATTPQLATGERVIFSEEFNDNSNNWTGVGAGSGKATIGIDPGGSGATVWYPSVNADGVQVNGSMTMTDPVTLANGPISIYMRVRVEGGNVQEGNKFAVELTEQAPGSHYGMLLIRPGGSAFMYYTNIAGSGTSTPVSSYSPPNGTTFVDYKLAFSRNSDGTVAQQVYYYNTTTSSYTSLGSVTSLVGSGVFNTITISSRNGSGAGRAYYDSVVVAQGPVQTGENYLFGDDFNAGLLPDWRFVDSGTTGSPWITGTDNATPMSNGVLINCKPTTQSLVQWDPVSLASTGDYMVLYMSVRTPVVNTSGSFGVSLLGTPAVLAGNIFGYTSDPLAGANGYAYSQSYNSSTVNIQRIINDVPGNLSTQSGTSVVGDGNAHSFILKVARTASGIQYTSNVDSVVLTATDSSPASYTFDTLRINGGGYPVKIDNVLVSTTRPTNPITFELPHSYETSAGIFNSSGSLVRDLWKKEYFPPGAYTRTWDGLSNSGSSMPAGTYTAKVLYHNMDYTWDGLVGDTSSSFTGMTYRSLSTFRDMAIDSSGDVFLSYGYNEGLPGIMRTTTGNPQLPSNGMTADQNTVWNYVATDGINYYLADTGVGYDLNNTTFVTARKVSDGTAYTFSSGTSVKTSSGPSYPSAIDISKEINTPLSYDAAFVALHAATGLAVQTSGTLLAVPHGGLNEVELFNKTTGQLVTTLTVTAPGQVAFAASGDLWVLSGSSALRYTGLPGSPSVATTISGFSSPLAVAANPTNSDIILVADAGSSQQVKCYNSTGASQWTLGQLGGYPVNGPDVTSGKFWYWEFHNKVPLAYLAFQGDGSFWVGDPANYRVLHYSSAQAYLGQIAPLPAIYSIAADPNNPNRVFANDMEYSVDYTQTLTPGDPDTAFGGNGCWKLVKNWSGGLANFGDYSPFSNVVTLSNGHTYATASHNVAPVDTVSLELPASGAARITGTLAGNYSLYNNGDLRYVLYSGTANPFKQTIYKQSLTGFDGSYNPQWAAATVIASTPYLQSSGTIYYRDRLDPVIAGGWGMGPRIPITSSNLAVCYNAVGSSYTYTLSGSNYTFISEPNTHLGTVTVGGTGFLWQESPGAMSVQPDGQGTFTDLIGYGGHCGIGVFASGRNVIYGYDGQYAYFSNQYMHFYDDGLFVGQFGVTYGKGLDTASALSVPGIAGNIGTMSMVTLSSGTSYVYCSDESVHGGIHRWRLSGTANELSVSGSLGSSGTWSGISFMGGAGLWSGTNLVANPGFESEASTYTLSATGALAYPVTPVNWQVNTGTDGSGAGAFFTGWFDKNGGPATTTYARSLPYHATISKNGAYHVAPFQVINPIASGTYTLSAWVVSSGSQSVARMYCKKVPLSTTFDYTTSITANAAWTQITIPNIVITAGMAEIGFDVQGAAGQYIYIDDVSFSH